MHVFSATGRMTRILWFLTIPLTFNISLTFFNIYYLCSNDILLTFVMLIEREIFPTESKNLSYADKHFNIAIEENTNGFSKH